MLRRIRMISALAMLTLTPACAGMGQVSPEQKMAHTVAALNDPTTRMQLIDKCIGELPGKMGRLGPAFAGGMLGLDTKDVAPTVCRRIAQALTGGQITGADMVSIEQKTESPDLARRMGEIMAGRPLSSPPGSVSDPKVSPGGSLRDKLSI